MAQVKINARDYEVEVETTSTGTYIPIENLATLTINPGENEETADTTDYDSEGVYEQQIMQRGASMAMAGLELKDNATGAPQPGRARVEEMAGETKVGEDSLGKVRWRWRKTAGDWTGWPCTFSRGEIGGGTNAKSSWSATITKSGPTFTIDA